MYNINISDKTLKLGDVGVNKKEFRASKKPIALNLVHIDKIVINEKFKHSDSGSIYFIGYKDDDIIRPLCTVLPKLSGYIKYLNNGGRNMSFKIEDDTVLVKYNEIWKKIKRH